MATLKQIASWNATDNPLRRVIGRNCICRALTARGQDEHSQMILYSPDIEEETDVRWVYASKDDFVWDADRKKWVRREV